MIPNNYWSKWIPYDYAHFSYLDYHPSVDWTYGNISLSPYDEAFIWGELNISPRINNTLTIAEKMVEIRGHYKFTFDTIDPLAGVTQVNTTRSTIQDLNDYFYEFKKQGICEGAYFVPADTKSERGRLKIKERLNNSALCKTPFNNEKVERGVKTYLPTLWVLAPCKQVRISLKSWREEKGKPTVAYSHHCTGVEFLMKDTKFRAPLRVTERIPDRVAPKYFQGRRR